MRIIMVTLAAGLLFVSMTPFSSAYADDYYCPFEYDGVYDYMYYDDETVNGNIIVKEDMDCSLNGTTVYGNVLIYANGSLTASDVTVEGNIEAYMAKYVRLSSSDMDCMEDEGCMTSAVFGDIKLEYSPKYMPHEGMMPADWGSFVKHTMVDGNIQLYENWNPITLSENYITGDIQASYNWGDLVIEMNSVEGNIQVEENKGLVDITGNDDVNGDVQAFYNWGGVTIADNEIYGNLQCKGNDPMPEGSGNMVEGNAEDQCEGFDYSESTENTPATTGSTGNATATSSGSSANTSAAAATDDSAGGGATGPFLTLLLCAVAMLRSRRQRKLLA